MHQLSQVQTDGLVLLFRCLLFPNRNPPIVLQQVVLEQSLNNLCDDDCRHRKEGISRDLIILIELISNYWESGT
jgi:hypothetical protein